MPEPIEQESRLKPFILLTMGDPSGIGPEVVLKSIASLSVDERFRLAVVGSPAVMERWSNLLSLDLEAEVLDCGVAPGAVEPGRPTADGARAAYESVVKAVQLCKSEDAQAMVTAPVSKAAIQAAGYDFPGHTEFLARVTNAARFVMMFVHGNRRVALATTHLALRDVPGALTIDLVVEKLSALASGLHDFFAISDARIAVASLNPHAGEGGRLGDEEGRVLDPAIALARGLGIHVEGPFPADAIYRGLGGEAAGPGAGFDAVLAMYHDQGTIPAKLWGGGAGVNLTLGLPIVRASVDHGTAFDIAGQGAADAASMVAAVELAGGIALRRAGG